MLLSGCYEPDRDAVVASGRDFEVVRRCVRRSADPGQGWMVSGRYGDQPVDGLIAQGDEGLPSHRAAERSHATSTEALEAHC